MSSTREPGAALRFALEECGCALEAHEARALAESLIGLICSGVVVPVGGAAVHQAAFPSPEDELGQASCGQARTAHTYNMGSLNTSEGGDRE